MVVKLYSGSSCVSSRNARNWLIEHEVEFEEIPLSTMEFTRETFIEILALTEDGLDDIIATRSLSYKRMGEEYETYHLDELIKRVQEDHSLLKRPLIVGDRRLQVGFNADEIRQFIPRERRRVEYKEKGLGFYESA